MSSWWRRVPAHDAGAAWLARGRAAIAAARVLVGQGFLPEAVALASVAILHGGRAALAHVERKESHDLAGDFDALLVRSGRLQPRFLEVLQEAQERRAQAERDPLWVPPGDEARTALARAISFLNGIQALLEA